MKNMLKRCEEEVEEILSEVGGVPDSLVVYLWYTVHYSHKQGEVNSW